MSKKIPQPPDLAALIEQHQLVQGKPCVACGCELYRTTMYRWTQPACIRCYPPRGYHEWCDLVDAL